jgi:non-ribosomal peptide synthase protein (TIGR01720 family)
LGGDSILSIQVIARARDAGLRFAPKQPFQHQTIAELAAVEGTCQTIDAEQGPVVGPAPLTPIQRWFFDEEPLDAQHFNQALLLAVDPSVRPETVEEALQLLCLHHDALRLRFRREGEEWTQLHAEEAAWPLTRFDLSRHESDAQAAALSAEIDRLQSSLNLADGPLAVAGWFEFGAGRTSRLLLAVHHLAVDAVSWRILLEDLSALYAQLAAGARPALPPKTTSFQAWSRRLAELATSDAVRQEAPYWLESARRRVEPLPRDFASGENDYGSAREVAGALEVGETTALLEQAPAAYRTEINDLLLAALARTLAEWTGDSRVLVDLESHGRLPLFDDADVSRTVGWFTHSYPICLNLPAGLADAEVLRKTKDALRRVPQGGVGYGLLRYLSGDETAKKLKALPQAELSFNYLGRLGGLLPEGGPWALAAESSGALQSPRAKRRRLLEINAYILEGRLQVIWSYSQRIHRRETVERLAESYLGNLRSLIAHCCSDEAGGAAPEDFPLADLDHQAIDQVARLLDELDNLG